MQQENCFNTPGVLELVNTFKHVPGNTFRLWVYEWVTGKSLQEPMTVARNAHEHFAIIFVDSKPNHGEAESDNVWETDDMSNGIRASTCRILGNLS